MAGLTAWRQPTSTPKRQNNSYIKEQTKGTPKETRTETHKDTAKETTQETPVTEAVVEDGGNEVDDSFSSDELEEEPEGIFSQAEANIYVLIAI